MVWEKAKNYDYLLQIFEKYKYQQGKIVIGIKCKPLKGKTTELEQKLRKMEPNNNASV